MVYSHEDHTCVVCFAESTFCNGLTSIEWNKCPVVAGCTTLEMAVRAATPLTCGSNTSGDIINGTHYIGQTSPEVFFGINITVATTLTVDTCGSAFDTVLWIWRQVSRHVLV